MLQKMIFTDATTYSAAYNQQYPLTSNKRPVLPPLVASEKKNAAVYHHRNVETLTQYKNNFPFNSYWTRPVVVPDARKAKEEIVSLVYGKTIDEHLLEAIRTRPRQVMTPAFSLDDVTDPAVRDVLVRTTYVSTAQRASMEVEVVAEGVKAPLPLLPAPANPIVLPKLVPPKVPVEWRMESLSWDKRQLRSYVEPDREFWQQINLYKDCIPCKQTAQVRELRKILQ